MPTRLFLFISLFCITGHVCGQHLDKISPVFLTQGSPADSVSFILTATDYNTFQGKKVQYASSLQIIDADQPWPPRWFAVGPFDIDNTVIETPQPIVEHVFVDTMSELLAKPLINAQWQHGKLTFLSLARTKNGDEDARTREAVIICNSRLELVDTFVRNAKSVDTHDFRMKPDGEKLYFAMRDTVIDMRAVFKNESESAIALSYQSIEIADKNNKVVFQWNPLYHLKLDEMFLPYRYTPGTMHTGTALDWSHGSSLCWDEDGNILYSYKHIGIGKISRKDGHIMWKVDRNHQKPNAESDSIPIFMQHDFKSFKKGDGQLVYTVLSNGDSSRPFTTAYQFTVSTNGEHEPVFKLLKKFEPVAKVPNTGAGGNYDVEANGNYLINYGAFEGDSSANRLLFECRNKNDSITAQYKVPPRIICYRVHKMDGKEIIRPKIFTKHQELYVENIAKMHVWYRLSGPNNSVATQVGVGSSYKPTEDGVYCVTERFGVGYVVSNPIKVDWKF